MPSPLSAGPVPVFHPDHPHNRPVKPLGSAYNPNVPVSSRPPPSSYRLKSPGGMSDSDASVQSSPAVQRCFCGRIVADGGIYCSIGMPTCYQQKRYELMITDCARSDAFTSLCYKSNAGPSSYRQPISDTSSAPLSRYPSSAKSTASTVSELDSSAPEWNASHYRRLARADAKREERREERRRRRAEGSVASSTISRSTTYSSVSSSSISSRVPDLVHGHSRNISTASSASSAWSGSNLSRNPSSASNISSTSRRYRGDNVAVIQEDDDEEEFLDTRPYPIPGRTVGTGHKKSKSGHARKRIAEPIGMGKDMRDILEEIISMEKNFNLEEDDIVNDDGITPAPLPGLFTATFDKPPRTPSPIAPSRRRSIAPNAPIRGHRSSLSNPLGSPGGGYVNQGPPQRRPPSLMGLHQSSLSESHTALYLATASPVAPSRRSASPKLHSRNSLTFTPEKAGPVIPGLGGKFDSPIPTLISTPSRRRPQASPTGTYGTMNTWRFPGSATGGISTPRGPRVNTAIPRAQSEEPDSAQTAVPPHLLWPTQPMFPQSPGVDTPTFISALQHRPPLRLSTSGMNGPEAGSASGEMLPPHSGMRLGVLLGSGQGQDVDVDMDMDEDEDEGSTLHGHSMTTQLDGARPAGRGEYLPVFLEAEGFRQTRQWAA